MEIRDGYWHKSPVLGRYCGSGKISELIKSTSSRMQLSMVTTYRQAGLKGFAASYEGKFYSIHLVKSTNDISKLLLQLFAVAI